MNKIIKIKQEPAIDTGLDCLEVVPEYGTNSVDDLEQAQGILIKNEIEFCETNGNCDSVDSPSIIFCLDCDFKTCSELQFDHHSCISPRKGHITNQIEYFNCSECNYTASSKSKLQNHTVLHIQSRAKENNVRVFRCEKCSFITTLNNQYKLHLIKHKNQSCTELVFNKNIVSRFYVDFPKHDQYSCRQCTFVTDTKDVLMLHLTENHNEIFFKCSICASFIPLEDKKDHMRIHLQSHRQKRRKTISNANDCVAKNRILEKYLDVINKQSSRPMNKSTSQRHKNILPRPENPMCNALTTMENCNNVQATSANLFLPDVTNSPVYESCTNVNPFITCNNVPVVANVPVNTHVIQGYIPLPLNQNYVLFDSNIVAGVTQPFVQFNNQTNSLCAFQSNVNNVQGFTANYVPDSFNRSSFQPFVSKISELDQHIQGDTERVRSLSVDTYEPVTEKDVFKSKIMRKLSARSECKMRYILPKPKNALHHDI